ncbi:DUF5926 family protein [Jonesia quinghaiensis]|uniref:DUF5926 family protein n=1 Tax=Jonesia quinghaiensis TaxID=262806 RepID=UPI00041E9471|nr:DUF5926 family protein [Jonesia quinghaiensis]
MAKNTVDFVVRPLEGIPAEADLVAMREVVPAATVTAKTTEEYGSREFVFTTFLPDSWPALHREDGTVLLALQTLAGSGDLSRDLAANLLDAFDLEPGSPLVRSTLPGPGPRLQDIVDLTGNWTVEMHNNVDYWVDPAKEITPEIRKSLDEAAESMIDTVRLPSVNSAYWSRMGSKEFLRWSMPYSEDQVINAIARLHARRESAIGDARFLGAFRTCGIVIPVWELARGSEADDIDKDVAAYWPTLKAEIENNEPLDAAQRRAKAGIVSRQVTLR